MIPQTVKFLIKRKVSITRAITLYNIKEKNKIKLYCRDLSLKKS